MAMFFGWITGIIFFLIGLGLLMYVYLQGEFNCLSRSEAKMMKKDGLLSGEEEYMRTFRVARAEWDVIDVRKHVRYAIAFLLSGAIILIYLLLL